MAIKPRIKQTSKRVKGGWVPLRTVTNRVPPELWEAVLQKAFHEGTTAQDLNIKGLRWVTGTEKDAA